MSSRTFNSLSGASGSRKIRACTTCRQVKLRCDSSLTFPSPCSRCSRGHLQCRIEPEFKRTRTRHQLQEVVSQLNVIKNALEKNSADSSPHGMPSSSGADTWHGLEIGTMGERMYDGPASIPSDIFYRISLAHDLPEPSVSLGSAVIQRENLLTLLVHYKSHYNRHCPIFSGDRSITELYHSSHFLFWTIVIIASRWHPFLSDMYHILEGPYRDLLGKTLIGPLNDILQIQALVLLCTWPLAVEKQVYDPSWNYCGLVTNAALKLGIHNGSLAIYGQEVGSDSDVSMWLRTWMGCYVVNCTHSWHTGVSVSSRFTTALRSSPPPRTEAEKDFAGRVAVLQVFAKSTTVLESLDDQTDGYAIVQLMCKDLGALRDDHQEAWSLEAEILTLGSQLSLFAHQLERAALHQNYSNVTSQRQQMNTSRNIIVNLAYEVAIRLIHNFSELAATEIISTNKFDHTRATSPCSPAAAKDSGSEAGHDASSHFTYRYLPKHFMLLLTLAATMLFKARVAYPDAIQYNADLGRNHIQIAYDLFGKWSQEKDDEPSRIQRLIEVLSRAEQQHILNMTNALPRGERATGFVVVADAIRAGRSLREKVGIVVEDGKTKNIETNPSSGPHQTGSAASPGDTDRLESDQFGRDAQMNDPLSDWNFPWIFDLPQMLAQYDIDIEVEGASQGVAPFESDWNGTDSSIYSVDH